MNKGIKKKSIIKMAVLAILIILSWGFQRCMENDNRNTNWKIRSVMLSYKLQLAFDGSLVNIDDSLKIFYHGDMVLYKITQPYDVASVKFDTSGNMSDRNLIAEGAKATYFVYNKNYSFGFKYDSLNVTSCQRYPVDSLLRSHFSIHQEMFDNTHDSLVLSTAQIPDYDLVEKFIPRNKVDKTDPDSSYYYYSNKIKDIDYSLSRKLDSLKNTKLCKVRFIFNATSSKGVQSYDVPKREFQFEIKEVPVSNPEEIFAFFERHRKYGI